MQSLDALSLQRVPAKVDVMPLQAAAGEKAAAEEAAKLLEKAQEEPDEKETPEKDSGHMPVKRKRLGLQAMHVPLDEAGSVLLLSSSTTEILTCVSHKSGTGDLQAMALCVGGMCKIFLGIAKSLS